MNTVSTVGISRRILSRNGALVIVAALAAVALGATVFVWNRVGPVPPDASDAYKWATVTRVRGGDAVKIDENDEKVQYAGIRAPLEGEALHEEAKRRNAELVEGRKVRLRFDGEADRDKDGRVLAYLFDGDRCINAQLVREGLAWVRLTTASRLYADELLAAQSQARAARRGVWKSSGADRPSPASEKQYSADPKYGNFHRSSCEDAAKINPDRLIVFATRNSAFDRGFAPCHRCRP